MKKGKKSTRSTIWDQSSGICCGPFTGGIAISPSRSGERDGIPDGNGPSAEVEVEVDETGDPGEPDGMGIGEPGLGIGTGGVGVGTGTGQEEPVGDGSGSGADFDDAPAPGPGMVKGVPQLPQTGVGVGSKFRWPHLAHFIDGMFGTPL